MRKFGSAIGVFMLAIGPWLALLASLTSHQPGVVLAASEGLGFGTTELSAPLAPGTANTASGPFHIGGCSCRDVTVNADNQVTNSSVESGDARVTNFSLTYVTAGYAQQGDSKVNIKQTADAVSGDAIAGQILGINAAGGCAHIIVHAHNLVANTDVQSGDAIADNKSFVFLDPSLQRGDVKVNVDQNATAKSGTALAGQIIGVNGGSGPCGGVSIDATNDVHNVDVQTGEARTHNLSAITKCRTAGCFREIALLLHFAGSVQVCAVNGCEDMTVHQFIKALKEQANGTSIDKQIEAAASPTPNPNDDGRVNGTEIIPTPSPKVHHPRPSPTPTPDPSATPDTSPSPTPDGPHIAEMD